MDTSAPPCKYPRHFGTSAEVSWTFRHHLHFVYISVTLIYLFKKDYFIDDWWHIFWYFLYRPTTSLIFFVQGMQHTTELAWPLLYHGDANANIFIEANSFLFLPNANRLSLTRIFAASVRPSLRWTLTLTVCSIPTLYNQYVVIGYIILKRNKI